eukprot:SAG11_NODE_1390_length_5055_cov_2.299637_2_plen_241_part_00
MSAEPRERWHAQAATVNGTWAHLVAPSARDEYQIPWPHGRRVRLRRAVVFVRFHIRRALAAYVRQTKSGGRSCVRWAGGVRVGACACGCARKNYLSWAESRRLILCAVCSHGVSGAIRERAPGRVLRPEAEERTSEGSAQPWLLLCTRRVCSGGKNVKCLRPSSCANQALVFQTSTCARSISFHVLLSLPCSGSGQPRSAGIRLPALCSEGAGARGAWRHSPVRRRRSKSAAAAHASAAV